MTGAMYFDRVPVEVDGGITELVRGEETSLVERMAPLVRRQSLALDMGRVERIDAAGIAALITLYCDACKAGRRFSVVNASPRVREILALVGLEEILLAPGAEDEVHCGAELARSAA